jgi:hypothetical protein
MASQVYGIFITISVVVKNDNAKLNQFSYLFIKSTIRIKHINYDACNMKTRDKLSEQA